jgi:predicted nuclease of predicted toxin-antitoxin system
VKIKLDESVHGDVKAALTAWGHDVATAREEGLGGHPDVAIAAAVKAEGRCLVTLDVDFADVRRYPPGELSGVVVLRLRVPTAHLQVGRLLNFFAATPQVAGKLWILDETRTRDWTS